MKYRTEWNYKGVSFYVNEKLISSVKWPSLWQLLKYKLFIYEPPKTGMKK